MRLQNLIAGVGAGLDNSMRPFLIALLAVLAVVVLQGFLLMFRLFDQASVDSVAPASDSLAVVSRVEPAAVTSEQSFVMQARPVFWQSRRPLDPLPGELTPEELAASTPAKQLKGLQVSGIIANGDQSQVIVTHRGKQQRLTSGQDIDGWTLVEVRPDAVVFASAGAKDERRLSPMPVVLESAAENKPGGTNVTEELVTQEPEQVESLSLGG